MTTDREVINHGKVCPDCGSDEWHVRGSIKCEARELANLRREVAAWRALVGRFRFQAPYQVSHADHSWRCHAGDPAANYQHLAYGHGDTPQAAVVDLAAKLNLLPATGETKETP